MTTGHPNGNGRAVTKWVAGIVAALAVSYVSATTTWVFILTQRQAASEAHISAVQARVSALESGRTTPMAAETRAEFNALWREVERLRKP